MTLEDALKEDLIKIAKQFNLSSLILFGSRARDDCWERSDIDLAAYFKSPIDYLDFCDKVEELPTLLMFDVVNLSSDTVSLDLKKSIRDEGVMLYEKV